MCLCLNIPSIKNVSSKIFLAKKSTDIVANLVLKKVDVCQRLKIEDDREDDRLFDWRQIHGREGVKPPHLPPPLVKIWNTQPNEVKLFPDLKYY